MSNYDGTSQKHTKHTHELLKATVLEDRLRMMMMRVMKGSVSEWRDGLLVFQAYRFNNWYFSSVAHAFLKRLDKQNPSVYMLRFSRTIPLENSRNNRAGEGMYTHRLRLDKRDQSCYTNHCPMGLLLAAQPFRWQAGLIWLLFGNVSRQIWTRARRLAKR